MTIGRRLNQLLHACVAVSMAAYALAADQPGLMLIVLAVLGLEFAFVSRVGGRHLPRWAINLALGFATAVVLFELTRGGEGREFVSVIGRYLIWLQFIKLAEPKTPRNLGQALALTAMLAVGAVLTNVALIVGVLLLIYIPLFLASVVVFQLYAGHVGTYGIPQELGGDERRSMSRPKRRNRQPERDHAATPAPARHATLDRIVYASWLRRPARKLAAGPGLGRGLVGSIAIASLAIITGSIALFIMIPRGIGESFLGGRIPTTAGGPQISGFSPDLQLGGTGVISESTAIALYVRLSRAGHVIGSPDRTWYLRGFVMDRYDTQRGRWVRSDASDRMEHRRSAEPWIRPSSTPSHTDLVQEITIRNNRSRYLFSVFRPVRVEGADGEPLRENFIRPDGTIRLSAPAEGLVVYTVRSREGTPTLADELADLALDLPETDSDLEAELDAINEHQPEIEPGAAPVEENAPDRSPIQPPDHEQPDTGRTADADGAQDAGEALGDERRRRWQFDEGPIADLAASIAEQAGITLDPDRTPERDEIVRLAAAIERHLSLRCAYTLDQPPIRADEDPIEAFLFRVRRGHCEYFASASAALASAMRIPSRVVTGFHVSEWDPTGRRYIVRESSAHAWAEVEVAPGHWLVIDPSAEDIRELNRPPSGLLAGMRRLIDQVEFLWVSRVVTFDSSNQQELPFMDFSRMREWLESVNERVASTLQRNLDDPAGPREAPTAVQVIVNFIVIAGALVAALLAAVLLWKLVRRSMGRSRRSTIVRLADPVQRRRLRFYNTMLDRLNSLGQPKPDWQPPARHAAAIETAELRRTIERLTALYYADRFGGQPLTEPQLAEAELLLRTLDKHATPANHRP